MAEREFPAGNDKGKTEIPGADPITTPTREREKKVEKIEGLGEVVAKKPGLGARFKNTFFGGDAKQTAKDVWGSVVVPMLQNTMLDAIQQGSEKMIVGQVRSRSTMGTLPNILGLGHQAYNRMYQNGPMGSQGLAQPLQQQTTRQQRATHDFSNFVVESKVGAEMVIDRMYNLLSRDGTVTVADFMDLIGEPADYTMQKWGWVDLRGSQIVRVPQGYLLDLPRPVVLD